jgi:DNA-binding transcriptional LysR family regulator
VLDQLRSLAVFAKVAELGSFRAAARALALSPSVVSHHVGELERRLALPLLYRSTRSIALTPDGEQLVAAAREMVDAAARGLDAVSGRSAAPSGALRLTAPAFLAGTGLSRHLAAFSSKHPNVRLTVSFTDAPRDLLRDGLDLALRIGKLADSTHRTRKLAEMRRVLVASPRYAAARRPPASLGRAQQRRAQQALADIDTLVQFRPGPLAAASSIGIGAIVEVEDADTGEGRTFFLAPVGAGITLTGPGGDGHLSVVTPASPIGRAVFGKKSGDVVDITVDGDVREWSITYVG